MDKSLKCDPSEMNKFILDAARNKEPVFNSYKFFCETHPNLKIDFVDFEWKYYQFYHGNHDLTIERRSDNSSPVTFSDLPIDILQTLVMKELDLKNRMILRKVSRDLRDLIDTTEASFHGVGFFFRADYSRMELEDFCVEYDKTDDGSTRLIWFTAYDSYDFILFDKEKPKDEVKQYSDDRSFETAMLADASTILKNPKLKIGHLTFDIKYNAPCSEFLKFLKSLNFQLNVRSIRIKKANPSFETGESLFSILQFVKPKTLEHISIDSSFSTIEQLDEISETEHWKKAKSLDCELFPNGFRMEKMPHFKKIQINGIEFSDENVIMIRDILLKSANLELCRLVSQNHYDFMGDYSYLFLTENYEGEYDDWAGEQDENAVEHVQQNFAYGYDDDSDDDDYSYEENEDERIDRILSEDPAYDVETRRFSIPNSQDYFQLKFKDSYRVAAIQIEKVSLDK